MSLVCEPLNALAVIVISHISRERDHGTGMIVTHRAQHWPQVQWPIYYFDVADGLHTAIIGVQR